MTQKNGRDAIQSIAHKKATKIINAFQRKYPRSGIIVTVVEGHEQGAVVVTTHNLKRADDAARCLDIASRDVKAQDAKKRLIEADEQEHSN